MEHTISLLQPNIDFSKFKKITLLQCPADFRCGTDGLVSAVTLAELNASDGGLYIFTNKSKHIIRGIYYDGTGFWKIEKRTAHGCYKWPKTDDRKDYILITYDQFMALLNGFRIAPNEYFRSKWPRFN